MSVSTAAESLEGIDMGRNLRKEKKSLRFSAIITGASKGGSLEVGTWVHDQMSL